MSHVKGDSQGTSSYLIKVILGYRIAYQSLGVVCQLFFIVDAEEAPFFPPYLSTFTCVSVGIVGCQESNWCKLEWHI